MERITEIEQSIAPLPPGEFFSLLGWMAERHLAVLASDEFESAELESELLKSVDSPRYPVDDELFEQIRAMAE